MLDMNDRETNNFIKKKNLFDFRWSYLYYVQTKRSSFLKSLQKYQI